MTIFEFEQAVLEREEIRLVIKGSWRTQIDDYEYQRAASGSSSITEWLQTRIHPLLNGHEVVVIDGNGNSPHGRTRLSTVRTSFER